MKNIKEKGFALILSLVLLLAMSLMGGALILISSEDHKSNNIVDVNQQTFYVAEMALSEGERYLQNQLEGPWRPDGTRDLIAANLPTNLATDFDGVMTSMPVESPPILAVNDRICRNSFGDMTSMPVESPPILAVNDRICRNSFGDLPDTLRVIVAQSWNFGTFLTDSNIPTGDDQDYLNNFYYEYFITRLGAANFKGAGSSAKRGSGGLGSGKNGMAYRVYGCGIYNDTVNTETVVTLESIVILPLS